MKDLINKLISCGIKESEAKKEISILQKEFTDIHKIQAIVNERIKTRTPIQQLLGKAYFMDFEVKINKSVLIPRPETEILVEETVKRLPKNKKLVALDIGTGSGIIPIALCKMLPNIEVFAIDIDNSILELAYKNARMHSLEQRIHFKKYDLFSYSINKLFKKIDFDLIICNPPYIREEEMQKFRPEIYLHEPRIALTGSIENKTGLIYYERIIYIIKKHIKKGFINKKNTLIAFEIDPPLVNSLKNTLREEGFKMYDIVKDYAKLDRCLFIYSPVESFKKVLKNSLSIGSSYYIRNLPVKKKKKKGDD